MENQQLYNLSKEEIQLLISAYLGDGCFIRQSASSNYSVVFSSINKDSLEFKKSLLKTLVSGEILQKDNSMGYNPLGKIYFLRINTNNAISEFIALSLEEKLKLINDLGIALWVYDDGSLHKNKLFYNICTHSFSFEENLLFVEYLKKFNIEAKITKETKKDGRVFWYLRVSRYEGAKEITDILRKYYIKSLDYKLWSSTTIQEWSTNQEIWKKGKPMSFKSFMKSKKRIKLG